MEAIGVLEELLKIKKMHFGTNSREVRAFYDNVWILTSPLVYSFMQITLRNMQHPCSVLFEEGGHQ